MATIDDTTSSTTEISTPTPTPSSATPSTPSTTSTPQTNPTPSSSTPTTTTTSSTTNTTSTKESNTNNNTNTNKDNTPTSTSKSSSYSSTTNTTLEFEPPLACVRRLLKNNLPTATNVGRDASSAFARACGIFVIYLTACANDFAREGKRQTITANDILAALKELDFDEFTPQITAFLEKHREEEKVKREKKKNSTPSKSIKREAREESLNPITSTAVGGDGDGADVDVLDAGMEEDVNDDVTSIGLLGEEDESSTVGSTSGPPPATSSKKRKKSHDDGMEDDDGTKADEVDVTPTTTPAKRVKTVDVNESSPVAEVNIAELQDKVDDDEAEDDDSVEAEAEVAVDVEDDDDDDDEDMENDVSAIAD